MAHKWHISTNTVFGGKKFWEIVSPRFSERAFRRESIILKKNDETDTDNYKLAETFNKIFSNVFSNITPNLDVNSNLKGTTSTSAPSLSTVKKYEYHQSIVRMKWEMNNKK